MKNKYRDFFKLSVLKKNLLVFAIALSTIACIHNYNDPEQLGKDFCDCMKKNDSDKDFYYAMTVCDGKLVQLYPEYRISRVDLKYNREYMDSLSLKSSERNGKFMNEFDGYVRDHCCEVLFFCKDSVSGKNEK